MKLNIEQGVKKVATLAGAAPTASSALGAAAYQVAADLIDHSARPSFLRTAIAAACGSVLSLTLHSTMRAVSENA